MITDDMIRCWRTNYGLEGMTPAESAAWWDGKLGHAPAGAVAALGTCINEIERLLELRAEHELMIEENASMKLALRLIAEHQSATPVIVTLATRALGYEDEESP